MCVRMAIKKVLYSIKNVEPPLPYLKTQDFPRHLRPFSVFSFSHTFASIQSKFCLESLVSKVHLRNTSKHKKPARDTGSKAEQPLSRVTESSAKRHSIAPLRSIAQNSLALHSVAKHH